MAPNPPRSPFWTEEQMEEKPGASWRLAIFLREKTVESLRVYKKKSETPIKPGIEQL